MIGSLYDQIGLARVFPKSYHASAKWFRQEILMRLAHPGTSKRYHAKKLSKQEGHQISEDKLYRMVDMLTDKKRCLAHALVATRCIAPGSELYTDRWLHDESSLYSILHLGLGTPSLNSLYHIGEKLYDHKENLMNGLFNQSQELFNYTKTIGFFDLTNVYYYGKAMVIYWPMVVVKRSFRIVY